MALVLTMKKNEEVTLGDDITIAIVSHTSTRTTLAIKAPEDVTILRKNTSPHDPTRPMTAKQWRRYAAVTARALREVSNATHIAALQTARQCALDKAEELESTKAVPAHQ